MSTLTLDERSRKTEVLKLKISQGLSSKTMSSFVLPSELPITFFSNPEFVENLGLEKSDEISRIFEDYYRTHPRVEMSTGAKPLTTAAAQFTGPDMKKKFESISEELNNINLYGGIRRIAALEFTAPLLTSQLDDPLPTDIDQNKFPNCVRYNSSEKKLELYTSMRYADYILLYNLAGSDNKYIKYKNAVSYLFLSQPLIRRLFIGDLVWMFYFDRMGIHRILGVILDDYANNGKFPIPSNKITAWLLEIMVLLTKMGASSTVRDRESSYRRCLGWTLDKEGKLGLNSSINKAFNNLFHKLIQTSLEYFNNRRLAAAIQQQASPRASVATLTAVRDTIEVLKQAFKPFEYGRNYFNTDNGIAWTIGAVALIKELRDALGIPQDYTTPEQFIPAAYDILIANKQITPTMDNRYTLHRDCAVSARNILLDLEVINHQDSEELELWLDLIEDQVEGYRAAYRQLTGADLAAPPAPGVPKIEQQA